MGTRITEHPILGVPAKGRLVSFTYDGQKLQGYEGEPIAMALKAAGVAVHRFTAKKLLRDRPLHGLRHGRRRRAQHPHLHDPACGGHERPDTVRQLRRALRQAGPRLREGR